MDLSAPEVDTELVDLSGVTLAALGSLDPVAVDHAARRLLDTDRRPTLGSSSDAGACPDKAEPDPPPGAPAAVPAVRPAR